jgi:3-hydroxyisobutyrate dehydrogenase-like beta-hydroxyacid dehydrogenase
MRAVGDGRREHAQCFMIVGLSIQLGAEPGSLTRASVSVRGRDEGDAMATGLVGLGLLGGALVRRLVETGEPPVVFDIRLGAVETAAAVGAVPVASCRELAERCDEVLVCVQTDQQCFDAVTGPHGVLDGAQPGTCVAVVATVLPSTIATLAAECRQREVDLVDTPLAGRGMFGVEEGSMAVLVGDDGALVERLEPTLTRFASRVVRAGPLGSGAALKIAHNVIVFAGFAAMIEGVELARAAGIRDGVLEELALGSGALSELSAFTVPFYKHLRDDPHAPDEDDLLHTGAALLEKDLGDAVALGELYGVDVPVARLLSHAGDRIFLLDR